MYRIIRCRWCALTSPMRTFFLWLCNNCRVFMSYCFLATYCSVCSACAPQHHDSDHFTRSRTEKKKVNAVWMSETTWGGSSSTQTRQHESFAHFPRTFLLCSFCFMQTFSSDWFPLNSCLLSLFFYPPQLVLSCLLEEPTNIPLDQAFYSKAGPVRVCSWWCTIAFLRCRWESSVKVLLRETSQQCLSILRLYWCSAPDKCAPVLILSPECGCVCIISRCTRRRASDCTGPIDVVSAEQGRLSGGATCPR